MACAKACGWQAWRRADIRDQGRSAADRLRGPPPSRAPGHDEGLEKRAAALADRDNGRTMNDDEVTVGMAVPLDSDGFLRRECPTCEREFKWLAATDEDDASDPPDGGYFCPYCAIQAPPDAWFTQAQLELAENIVARDVVGPMLDDFSRDLKRMGRQSGGLLDVTVSHDGPEEMDPLVEEDDMRRVDFPCHPAEPIKVLDDWDGPVHCLMCGQPA